MSRLSLLLRTSLLLLLLLLLGAVAGHQNCKKTVRAAFERCNSGRNKRSLIIDILRPPAGHSPVADFSGVLGENESRREITIREINIFSSLLPFHGVSYASTAPSDSGQMDDPPVVPPTATDHPTKFLPVESGSSMGLGLGMSYVEIDELYDEFLRGTRNIRGPLSDAKDEFLYSVVRCCMNQKDCLENGVFPCGR